MMPTPDRRSALGVFKDLGPTEFAQRLIQIGEVEDLPERGDLGIFEISPLLENIEIGAHRRFRGVAVKRKTLVLDVEVIHLLSKPRLQLILSARANVFGESL